MNYMITGIRDSGVQLSNNTIAYYASEKGHREIVNKYIGLGANNYNQIAECAALRGHKAIVADMIKSYY